MVGIKQQPDTFPSYIEGKGLKRVKNDDDDHDENEEKIYFFIDEDNDNENKQKSIIHRCYQCLLFYTCSQMLFQNKRKTLSKRLWRARLPATNNHQQQLQLSDHRSAMDVGSCPSIGTDGGGRNVFRDCCVTNRPAYAPPTTPSSRNIAPEDYVRYQMFLELIRNLKDKQLETLSTAVSVECCGNDDLTSVKSDCVLIPKNLCRTAEAHFIACQVWRWPDLRSHKELKRIPSCSSRQDPVYICCSPAHWSRVCETGELSIYLYLYRHIIISNSKKNTQGF